MISFYFPQQELLILPLRILRQQDTILIVTEHNTKRFKLCAIIAAFFLHATKQKQSIWLYPCNFYI